MSQNSAESARVQFFKYKVAKMSKIGTFGRLSGRLPDLEYVLSLVPKKTNYILKVLILLPGYNTHSN